MQSPLASADATSVITLSPGLARPGASPRSRCRSTSCGRPRCRASVAGRIRPALLTRRWSSKGNCSELWGSADYSASCGRAAKHGTSIANRSRPLKREQLRRRRFGCGRGGHLVASIRCSLFLVGFLSRKPLSQMHRSTFLPLQHAPTLISSVDWGLRNSSGVGKGIYKSVVQSDREFLNVGVSDRQ